MSSAASATAHQPHRALRSQTEKVEHCGDPSPRSPSAACSRCRMVSSSELRYASPLRPSSSQLGTLQEPHERLIRGFRSCGTGGAFAPGAAYFSRSLRQGQPRGFRNARSSWYRRKTSNAERSVGMGLGESRTLLAPVPRDSAPASLPCLSHLGASAALRTALARLPPRRYLSTVRHRPRLFGDMLYELLRRGNVVQLAYRSGK